MNEFKNLHYIFDSLPGKYLIFYPDEPRFTIAFSNQAFLKVTSTKDIEGKALFEVFTDNPDNPDATGVQNVLASLKEVLRTKKPHGMKVQRYDIKAPDGSFQERYWQPVNIPVIDDAGNITFIIHNAEDVTMEVLLRKQLKKTEQQSQRQIHEAVVTTQETERMGIAGELHDNINQILLTARLYLEFALSKQANQSAFLTSGIKLLEKAMLEIRLLSRSLFMPFTGQENLKTAIDQLLEHTASLRPVAVHKEIDLPEHKMDAKTKQTIFRIVQEQVSNAIKHSEAHNISVVAHSVNGSIEIMIKDDGIGFNPDHHVEGIGFKSIKERIMISGGTLKVHAEEGKGCLIQTLIPLQS